MSVSYWAAFVPGEEVPPSTSAGRHQDFTVQTRFYGLQNNVGRYVFWYGFSQNMEKMGKLRNFLCLSQVKWV